MKSIFLASVLYIKSEGKKMINCSSLVRSSPVHRNCRGFQRVILSAKGSLLAVVFCPSLILLITSQKRASQFFLQRNSWCISFQDPAHRINLSERQIRTQETLRNEKTSVICKSRLMVMTAFIFLSALQIIQSPSSATLAGNATLRTSYRFSCDFTTQTK